MHKATMKDLKEANKAVDESKQRFEQRKRAEDAEKEQEGLNFKTPSFREAHPKKVGAAKPAQRSYLARAAAEPSKRKLIDSSPSDDEGKLFEDFFTHTRGPPPPSF